MFTYKGIQIHTDTIQILEDTFKNTEYNVHIQRCTNTHRRNTHSSASTRMHRPNWWVGRNVISVIYRPSKYHITCYHLGQSAWYMVHHMVHVVHIWVSVIQVHGICDTCGTSYHPSKCHITACFHLGLG